MNRRHTARGQILPLWIVAVLTTLALTYMIINYGNTLRWQMRAQNAADAAAQALMAIQTEHFNEITAMLYASNVEEFRARLLLDGLLNALNGAGGCSSGNPTPKQTGETAFSTGTGSCDQVFANLMPYYEESVQRYTNDLFQLNDVAVLTTYAQWKSDSISMLTHLDSATRCNNTATTVVIPDAGDCAFQYTLNGIAYRTGLNAVALDAYTTFLPTQGMVMHPNTETQNAQLFDPGMIDVVTCAKVPPVFPLFASLHAKTHYVMGRAGATAVMSTVEWFQPGALVDPARGTSIVFQPYENYTPADAPPLAYDWYGVLFGGGNWSLATFADPYTAGKTDSTYSASANGNEFDADEGWWSAMPYDPRLVVPGAAAPTATADCPA
jgi:hypothetical protein